MEQFKKILSSVICLFLMVISLIGLSLAFKHERSSTYKNYEQANFFIAQKYFVEEQIKNLKEITKPIERLNKNQEVKDWNAQKKCDDEYGKGKKFCRNPY